MIKITKNNFKYCVKTKKIKNRLKFKKCNYVFVEKKIKRF